MMMRIEAPIRNFHPAKPPLNLWGELLQAMASLVFIYGIFCGAFALAAYLCANY